MKLLIVAIAFLCGALAQGPSDHLRVLLEQERENFPCGWPDYPWNEPHGIPPLEPFRSPRDWNLEFATLGSIYDMRSTITNQVIRGLQSFVLDHVQLEIIGMWMRINMHFPVLNVDGRHSTTGMLFQNGAFTPFSGAGTYIAQARTFRVDAMAALNFIQPGNFLNVRAMNSQVSMQSLQLHMEGFGALGTTINSIVNANLPAYIALPETQARLSQHIESIMMPVLNAKFNTVTMPEFVDFLAGRVNSPPPQRCFVRAGIKFEIL